MSASSSPHLTIHFAVFVRSLHAQPDLSTRSRATARRTKSFLNSVWSNASQCPPSDSHRLGTSPSSFASWHVYAEQQTKATRHLQCGGMLVRCHCHHNTTQQITTQTQFNRNFNDARTRWTPATSLARSFIRFRRRCPAPDCDCRRRTVVRSFVRSFVRLFVVVLANERTNKRTNERTNKNRHFLSFVLSVLRFSVFPFALTSAPTAFGKSGISDSVLLVFTNTQ